ncbi:MAG: trypsin-like peptidase domain-containing protein [Gallintestinimicrobium sp.]
MIQKTNVWKTAAGLLLTISMMISSVPMTAAAAEPAAQAESTETSDYGAPAYGTKAANLHRLTSQEQVQTVSKALQPVADVVGVMTKSHNVSVINYSDVDELGLIRRSDGSGVVLVMDGSRIYIATAAHCLKHNHTEVILPDGTRCSAAVLYRSTETDTGFLTVEYSQLPEEVLGGITPAAGADASALGMKTGDALVAVSSLDSRVLPAVSAFWISCPSSIRTIRVRMCCSLFGNELRFKRRRGLYAEWDLGWEYFRW